MSRSVSPVNVAPAARPGAAPLRTRADAATVDRCPWTPPPRQIAGFNFDWDDNIFFMPTPIVLFDKKTGEKREVSTGHFAEIRDEVGKSGEWARYELRGEESFPYFRTGPNGENYFLRDLKAALAKGTGWKGPSWDAFVTACQRPQTAAGLSIITARGQTRQHILEGLRYLQAQGLLRYVPNPENLYTCSDPKLQQKLGVPPGDEVVPRTKAAAMINLLDRVQATPLPKAADEVLSADGTGKAPLHLWGFSDDDRGNYDTARDVLSRNIARWPNVKVTLFYTAGQHAELEPEQIVLKPDGTHRPLRAGELDEAAQVLFPDSFETRPPA